MSAQSERGEVSLSASGSAQRLRSLGLELHCIVPCRHCAAGALKRSGQISSAQLASFHRMGRIYRPFDFAHRVNDTRSFWPNKLAPFYSVNPKILNPATDSEQFEQWTSISLNGVDDERASNLQLPSSCNASRSSPLHSAYKSRSCDSRANRWISPTVSFHSPTPAKRRLEGWHDAADLEVT